MMGALLYHVQIYMLLILISVLEWFTVTRRSGSSRISGSHRLTATAADSLE